jgi:rod shape-determining protein MreD
LIQTLKIALIALTIAFLQAFILQQVDMGFWLHPMPYLMLFFIIPVNFDRFGYLILGFVFGTFIDLLSGSFGTHAASCVVMVFLKHYIDRRFVDFESLQLQGESYLSLQSRGWVTFFYYAISLIGIHHLVFFSLDFFSLSQLGDILLSALISSIGTFLIVLLYKNVFNK